MFLQMVLLNSPNALCHIVSAHEQTNSARKLRQRDGIYILSGLINLTVKFNDWFMFEAAHIFPLEKETIWIRDDFGRWITDMDNTTGYSKIDSCQNGLLMQRDFHAMYDNYLISINPDDGYKIIVFNRDVSGIDGGVLYVAIRWTYTVPPMSYLDGISGNQCLRT
ncbi:hypothetical protein BDV37DRAFT_177871 [Aspergillus pseudonomiae]|uniref:HNH nuclease domain-containing protein n=1 Tax=Aspergillus pseudonomiae TaxID=1506151 RepID=A0A5N7D5W1_9EURO|nr:uncharacterized protein BDV37DRAFT_177871 [Aspergillus pseudonomiae]KAE8401537.1 hypothetical protein BDV37DRAFT_177871 [Aspergillus pseudonomiae]